MPYFPFKFKSIHFWHIDINEDQLRHPSLLIDSWDDIIKCFFACEENRKRHMRVLLQYDFLKHFDIEKVIIYYHNFYLFAFFSHWAYPASLICFHYTSVSKCFNFVMNGVIFWIYRRKVPFDRFSLKYLNWKNCERKSRPEPLLRNYLYFSI